MKEKRDLWKDNHSVSECDYHIQLTIKYRRNVLTPEIENTMKEICTDFKDRYCIAITQIGFDGDHVHFYVRFLPKYDGGQVIRLMKSNTSRQIFKKHPDVKKFLWGGEFWTDGYYIGTISPHGNKNIIVNYIKNQGKAAKQRVGQLRLFDL